MATLEAGRWTKFLTSNTSSPYDDGDYYYDMRGGLSITYELNSAKTGYVLSITHKIQGKQDVSGYNYSWPTATVSSKVNGNSAGSYSGKPPTSYQTLGTKNLGTRTYTVPLASDGTCSCTITCTVTDGSHTRSWSVKYTLPTVNLSSSISNNSSTSNYIDFGSNITFSISRPNSSITHTLSYSINGTNYTIGSGIGESKTYAFPVSLINSFPSNEKVSVVVNCVNSNGMTSTTTVYLNVPSSYVPTCSLAISDVGVVPSIWGIWLKTKSRIKGVITASGSAGSSIKYYSSTVGGENFNSSEFLSNYINVSGNLTINVTVTDSRGRKAYASKTINIVDYFVPSTSSYEVDRCNATGGIDNDGTYGIGKCSYSICPILVNGVNKNAKKLKIKYGTIEKTYILDNYSGNFVQNVSDIFSDLATNANHVFEFTLIDQFYENIKFYYTMPPSFVLISKLTGGKGITFGQIASQEGFRIEMDAFYKGQAFLETEDVDEW